MKIEKVAVTYGELRSSGYPDFSNKRHEIILEASLEKGESAKVASIKLREITVKEVKRLFGDNVEQGEFEMPF